MPVPIVRVAACLLLVSAAGCAVNPVSGRPEVVLTSVEGERQIGRQETEKLERRVGFIHDPKLTDYVRAVGQRVAAHSPRQDISYVCNIVDTPQPNAFALPGGYVFVTRGLLALMNSEDELANVLGHEIGHVAARHSVQRLSAAAPFAIVTGVGATATGIVSPHLAQAVAGIGQLAGAVALAPYSRSQEREADRVGQEMAAAAGWNPRAMASFLHTLERERKLQGDGPHRLGFLDTHPTTGDRVHDTHEHAVGLARASTPPIAVGRAGFLERLDGLLVGRDPAEGVFVDARFVHPDLGFGLRLPEGWKHVNTRTYVAAVAPAEDAFAVLQYIGEAEDPIEPAQAVQEKTALRFPQPPERLTIGDLPATRAIAELNASRLDLTWIALGTDIYQITGVSGASTFPTYQPQFAAIGKSFHTLSAEDRAQIMDTRLRVVSADGAETLERVVARTGSVWSLEQMAVANGLEPGRPLPEGMLIKVPVREVYQPRSS